MPTVMETVVERTKGETAIATTTEKGVGNGDCIEEARKGKWVDGDADGASRVTMSTQDMVDVTITIT
ncbi:hypothetical protein L484_021758 [Morus notabilis]|uniref:Uncharacterized protein n=1 Tax=Morus notabilis TaxID=981085 RepID=W9RKH1_9ROSA|nr:hypothetical protein L484_004234 [Morus notabilis]EXB94905.1 hypothetical protein L484_023013 [Morus notabilis]EXC14259.1 hypothetical protein L484_021758 [Morus notabilis]